MVLLIMRFLQLFVKDLNVFPESIDLQPYFLIICFLFFQFCAELVALCLEHPHYFALNPALGPLYLLHHRLLGLVVDFLLLFLGKGFSLDHLFVDFHLLVRNRTSFYAIILGLEAVVSCGLRILPGGLFAALAN